VFTRRGVTRWRRALTDVTADHATPVLPGSRAAMSASLPVAVTAELVDALAGTGSHRGAPIRLLRVTQDDDDGVIRFDDDPMMRTAPPGRHTAQGGELRDSQGEELRDGQPLKPGEIRDR
jgi:hypothetical protein